MTKRFVLQIDKAIKDIWINEIKDDYDNHLLLKEDCLKNAFYHHLRNKLGNDFFMKNNIRIYTEFNDGVLKGTKKRADIVLARINCTCQGYLGHNIKDIIAIIELKYKASYSAAETIYSDIDKVKSYIQQQGIDCQYYLGIIHEVKWEKMTWLDKRSTNNWANGKVTELNASFNENSDMVFEVNPYNNLN